MRADSPGVFLHEIELLIVQRLCIPFEPLKPFTKFSDNESANFWKQSFSNFCVKSVGMLGEVTLYSLPLESIYQDFGNMYT